MNATSFIVVFRPHQRPAWAETFDSEEAFCDAWVNGNFARSCNAEPAADEEATFDAAWAGVGHDLNAITRLDSAEEVQRYLSERDYAGHHNKGLSDVRRCAVELGWIEIEEEEAE